MSEPDDEAHNEQASATLDALIAAGATGDSPEATAAGLEPRVAAMLAARDALRDDDDALAPEALAAMVRSAAQAASSSSAGLHPAQGIEADRAPANRSGARPWLAAAAALIVAVAGLGLWVTRQSGGDTTESADAPAPAMSAKGATAPGDAAGNVPNTVTTSGAASSAGGAPGTVTAVSPAEGSMDAAAPRVGAVAAGGPVQALGAAAREGAAIVALALR